MAKKTMSDKSSEMGKQEALAQLEDLLRQAARLPGGAPSPRAGQRQGPGLGEQAAKLWLDGARLDPWSVGRKKIEAAMQSTFASEAHDGVAAHALGWLLSRPLPERREGLIFFGSLQRQEDCPFLPLSMVAAESGGQMAEGLARAGVEDLLALGEGICPSFPRAGAAQLAAAASASAGCPPELRQGAIQALAEICREDPRAAQFALMSLDPEDSWLCAGIDFKWPPAADYKRAFSGSTLDRGALLHLLSRHREGDKLLKWCEAAGFEGAAWPGSKAACRIGGGESWLPAGLAETDATRLRDDEAGLFAQLGAEKEDLSLEERNALAKEFGARPDLAEAAHKLAPWITQQVYDDPRSARASWAALAERVREVESLGLRKEFDQGLSMALSLARIVGLGNLPKQAAWVHEKMDMEAKRLQQRREPGSDRRLAEIEGLLMRSDTPAGKRRPRPKTL